VSHRVEYGTLVDRSGSLVDEVSALVPLKSFYFLLCVRIHIKHGKVLIFLRNLKTLKMLALSFPASNMCLNYDRHT
jgi:hypothetical protein